MRLEGIHQTLLCHSLLSWSSVANSWGEMETSNDGNPTVSFQLDD